MKCFIKAFVMFMAVVLINSISFVYANEKGSAFAAENYEYKSYFAFEREGIALELPKEYLTLARGMTQKELHGASVYESPEETNKYLEEHNMLLESLSKDGNIGLSVYAYADKESIDIFDLSEINEKEVYDFLKGYTDEKKKDFEIDEEKISVINKGSLRFIEVFGKEDEYGFTSLYYCTVYNGIKFEFILTQYEEGITKEGLSILNNLLESVRFTKKLTKEEAELLIKRNLIKDEFSVFLNKSLYLKGGIIIVVIFSFIAYFNRFKFMKSKTKK